MVGRQPTAFRAQSVRYEIVTLAVVIVIGTVEMSASNSTANVIRDEHITCQQVNSFYVARMAFRRRHGSYSREGPPIIMGRRCKWDNFKSARRVLRRQALMLMSLAINFVINGGYGDASEVLILHSPLYQH